MTTNRGAATKERILDACVQLFDAGGFQNLRITKICEQVGIAPTSVYWHFGNKAGLVQAVLERAFAPVGVSMLEEIRSASGPRKASIFIEHLRRLIHERPLGTCSMLAYLQDQGHQSSDIDAALNQIRAAELNGQVELMGDSLGLKPKQAKRLAITLNACVNYAVMIKLVGGADEDIEDVLDTIKQGIVAAAKGH